MKRGLIILFVLVSALLKAQSEVEEHQSTIRVGVKYTNDYVFMGRTDSLEAPYLTPSITYFHKSGFMAKGSFSYLTAPNQNRIDLSVLTIGYNASGKNLYGGGSLSGYFFNDQSYSVSSALGGFLNGYIGYDFLLFELSADGSLGWSESLDFFTGLELSRTFYMFKNHLLITPSVYANAGSQNYYNEYYSTRSSKITQGKGYGKGAGVGSSNTTSSGSTIVIVEEASDFKVLDYEFSTAITFKKDKWRLVFIPTYVIPVNPSTVTVDESIVFEEALDNVFFWSLSLAYSF